MDDLALITPPYLRPWLNESVPSGKCVAGGSSTWPPAPMLGPGTPIRAQRGKSDSGALAFQKRAGENEPWRKSEVIIFIISQGSNRGNGNLWGGWEREPEREREMRKLFLQPADWPIQAPVVINICICKRVLQLGKFGKRFSPAPRAWNQQGSTVSITVCMHSCARGLHRHTPTKSNYVYSVTLYSQPNAVPGCTCVF